MSRRNSELFRRLAGNFYESNRERDYVSLTDSITSLESFIVSGDITGEDFAEYYNETYSGRSVYNVTLNAADYPPESILREIFQNICDCHYDSKDVKIAVKFKGNGVISIAYNEIGFSLENFMYYLSFGRNGGDRSREGRFGLGAKSVFMNTEWFSMRSGSFRLKINGDHSNLFIETIELLAPNFNGTELAFKIEDSRYFKIKDNLFSFAEKKGEFLNLPEIAFAFCRKKVMNSNKSSKEENERTFKIAITDENRETISYGFERGFRSGGEKKKFNTVKFSVAERSAAAASKFDSGLGDVRGIGELRLAAEFIEYNYRILTFLIPLGISPRFKEGIENVINAGYNKFSTYELTGLIRAGDFEKEYKQSPFFISVPNYYVTPYRTGIRNDCEFELVQNISDGVKNLIVDCAEDLAVEISPFGEKTDDGFQPATIRPETYVFSQIKKFVFSNGAPVEGGFSDDVKALFLNSISVRFPRENPVSYVELVEYSFHAAADNISYKSFADGSAYREYIEKELELQENRSKFLKVKSLCATFVYDDEQEQFLGRAVKKGGRCFEYRFYRQNGNYLVTSDFMVEKESFELPAGFKSVAVKNLSEIFGGAYSIYAFENERNNPIPSERTPKIQNETQLEQIFALFDGLYGDKYAINIKYYRITLSRGRKEYSFEAAKMQVSNLKSAVDSIRTRYYRFERPEEYNEILKLFIEIFSEGKDDVETLRQASAQGCDVRPGRDINGRNAYFLYNTIYVCEEDIPGIPTAIKIALKPRTSAAIAAPPTVPYEEKTPPVMTKTEFESLTSLVRDITTFKYEKAFVYRFVRDINHKLWGYGAYCPLCEHYLRDLGGFKVKEFLLPKPGSADNHGKDFRFSLFMCADEAAHSDSWYMSGVSIGGMSPIDWVAEIKNILKDGLEIASEYLICRFNIEYYETYTLPERDSPEMERDLPQDVKCGSSAEIYLSPLLAAKIYYDNMG